MGNNLCKIIQEYLNLDMLQEFKVKDCSEVFKFNKEGIQVLSQSGWQPAHDTCFSNVNLETLLLNPDTITTVVYKPKNDESYWCWGDDHKIYEFPWSGSLEDLEHYAVGNCYRSYDEAKESLTKLEEKLCTIFYGSK